MIKPEEGVQLHRLAPPVCAEEDAQEAWKAVKAVIAQRDRLHRALEDCADPIQMLRREAHAQGRELNGHVAHSFAQDANFIKKLARDALVAEDT